LRALSVRTARCYSFFRESSVLIAGEIVGGDFVVRAGVLVCLFGDLRELFEFERGDGDGES